MLEQTEYQLVVLDYRGNRENGDRIHVFQTSWRKIQRYSKNLGGTESY